MSARLRRVQGSARGWERRGESPGLRGMLNLDPKRRGIAAWSACVPHCLCSPLWIYFSPSFSIAVDRMRLKSLIGDEKRGEERGKAGGRSNGVGERERGPSTAEKKRTRSLLFCSAASDSELFGPRSVARSSSRVLLAALLLFSSHGHCCFSPLSISGNLTRKPKQYSHIKKKRNEKKQRSSPSPRSTSRGSLPPRPLPRARTTSPSTPPRASPWASRPRRSPTTR